jgi:hypothetical protein
MLSDVDMEETLQRSVYVHFQNYLKTGIYGIHLEGYPRNVASYEGWYEIRFDVNDTIDQQQTRFLYKCTVDILCQTKEKNAFALSRMLYQARKACSRMIPVINEETLVIGYLMMDGPKVRTARFTNPQNDTPIKQGSIEARYKITL